MTRKTPTTGTERTRDERRRNDDANPSELGPAAADNLDDEAAADPELAAAEASGAIVGSAEHAGMGRGDHPHASRSRGQFAAVSNPKVDPTRHKPS